MHIILGCVADVLSVTGSRSLQYTLDGLYYARGVVVKAATLFYRIPCITLSYRTECGKMRRTYWINNTSTLNMYMCEKCMTLYEVSFREIPLMWNSICIGCGVETRTQLWIRRTAQIPVGVYDD